MNLPFYLIIALLLVALAVIVTVVVVRSRYGARLLDAGTKVHLLDDTTQKASKLEAEVRELLGFKTLADEREGALSTAKSDLSRIQAELTASVAENRGLRTQLEQQQVVLEQTFSKMQADFQILGQKMLEESSQKLNERSKETLKTVLDPLTHDLGEFKKRIEATHTEDMVQRTTLQEQVKALSDLNQKISKDAENLTKALKGESKTQGTWGEMVLEKVLEASGLRKDEEYELQKSLTGADGKRLQPDVIVHLPEKRDVVIDSKVSLVAYEEFARAEIEEERTASAARLVASIRNHMKGLSAKAYQNLEGIDSIDYVIMFVANEGALSVAMMADRQLLEDAVKQNVMLASPTNLLATLKGIEYGWRSERQNRNVQAIFKAAGDLYDKFVGFASDMDELGSRIDQARQSYDSARGKLIAGRGNLTGRVEKLRELGAKSTKALPAGWEDEAEPTGTAGISTEDAAS